MKKSAKLFIILLLLLIISQIGFSQKTISGISKIYILDDTSFIYNDVYGHFSDVIFILGANKLPNKGTRPLKVTNFTCFKDEFLWPINYTIFDRNIFSIVIYDMSQIQYLMDWGYVAVGYDMDSGEFLHTKHPYSNGFTFDLHFRQSLPDNHILHKSKNRPYYDLVKMNDRNFLVLSTGQEVFVFGSQDPTNLDCEESYDSGDWPFGIMPLKAKIQYRHKGSCDDEWYIIKHFDLEKVTDKKASNQRGYFRIYVDESNQIVLAYNNGQSYALDLRKDKLQELERPSVKDSTLVYDSRTDKYSWVPKLYEMEKFTSPDSVRTFLKSIGQ